MNLSSQIQKEGENQKWTPKTLFSDDTQSVWWIWCLAHNRVQEGNEQSQSFSKVGNVIRDPSP